MCACPDGHQIATVLGSHAQIVAFLENSCNTTDDQGVVCSPRRVLERLFFWTPPRCGPWCSRYHVFNMVTHHRVASRSKSHVAVLSARMCVQASMWFMSVFVFCRQLSLLHDTSVCLSRYSGGHVAPQSMRVTCETLVGHLITANHKVLSEGCESRNNHRYAVVVQDLATQWIQS